MAPAAGLYPLQESLAGWRFLVDSTTCTLKLSPAVPPVKLHEENRAIRSATISAMRP